MDIFVLIHVVLIIWLLYLGIIGIYLVGFVWVGIAGLEFDDFMALYGDIYLR